MKKLIFVVICSLIGAGSLFGQNDQKARELLEQTSRKMQSYQSLSANFVFTMENPKMNIKEQNSGSLLLKGKKYQVQLPDLGMKVFCDGTTVWNLMEAAGQVMITSAGDESQGGLDPSALFNIYQEGYSYRFLQEKQEGGKAIAYIELIPQDKAAEFQKITAGIDKQALMVHSLITHGNDGNLYGIYVKDFRTGQPIADSEFLFDKSKYRNIEEIDLR